MIWEAVEALQAIDFGHVEAMDPEQRNQQLPDLEYIVDDLASVGLVFPEADAAIRFFVTEPALSRTYVYGPTDIQDGRGLLEQLKELGHLIDTAPEIPKDQVCGDIYKCINCDTMYYKSFDDYIILLNTSNNLSGLTKCKDIIIRNLIE